MFLASLNHLTYAYIWLNRSSTSNISNARSKFDLKPHYFLKSFNVCRSICEWPTFIVIAVVSACIQYRCHFLQWSLAENLWLKRIQLSNKNTILGSIIFNQYPIKTRFLQHEFTQILHTDTLVRLPRSPMWSMKSFVWTKTKTKPKTTATTPITIHHRNEKVAA